LGLSLVSIDLEGEAMKRVGRKGFYIYSFSIENGSAECMSLVFIKENRRYVIYIQP